ncbi:helicase associated domain-containing protein [Streptomyces pratensis]|uniref:helicase associated domain-containing protein n=1 Tax=Streptomyces pratensis TaxID=1169025 RepID=UPI00363E0305
MRSGCAAGTPPPTAGWCWAGSRQDPGEGKVSRIIVPVFLAPGEDPSDMMASPSCRSLVAVLQGLRAHDERVIERTALSTTTGRGQATSVIALDPVREEGDDGDHVQEEGAEDGTEETAAGSASGEGEETAEPAAQAGTDNDTADKEQAGTGAPLRGFSLPRNARDVALYLRTRVLHPDSEIWLSGYNALRHWVREHRSAEVPLDASVELGEDRITYALGAWVSEQRRAFRLGTLKAWRADLLNEVGMVWSVTDAGFWRNLTAARTYHSVDGTLAAPKDAVVQGVAFG